MTASDNKSIRNPIADCDREKYIERSILVNMTLLRKTASEKAQTGAILRVIRALLGIKGTYQLQELKKPFAVPTVTFSPDYSDANVRQAMLQQGMSSMGNMFGATSAPPTALPFATEAFADSFDPEENLDNPAFASDIPTDEENYTEDYQQAPPERGQEHRESPVQQEVGQEESTGCFCDECGKEITERAYEYSINKFGKALVYPFGFEPTYHRYRMDTLNKLKMGNNIFVGAMADVFGAWVPEKWIIDIFNVCTKRPHHNYMFLTKNPERYLELYATGKLPEADNLFYGATVTRGVQLERVTKVFTDLPDGFRTFFSIEPILEDIAAKEIWQEAILQTDWIIIGAQTGRSKDKVVPEMDWIRKIVVSADTAYGVPVFMKDSLIPIAGESNMRRDFPKQLQHSEISPKMKKKLFDVCADCKNHLKKSDMITLLARSKRGEQPKQFGFMCKECFKKFCEGLGLDIPKLAELAESITIGPGDSEDG